MLLKKSEDNKTIKNEPACKESIHLLQGKPQIMFWRLNVLDYATCLDVALISYTLSGDIWETLCAWFGTSVPQHKILNNVVCAKAQISLRIRLV